MAWYRYDILSVLAIGAVVAFGAAVARPAQAADARLLGNFDNWMAYEYEEGKGKVCYMASKPTKDEGKYARRGDIFAMITHRPNDHSLDVVSFIAGYSYQAGAEVNLEIGNEKFTLFTQNDTAWARDAETDKKISKAIRSGKTMVLRGSSSRGTPTVDTYSLAGSGKAYEAINKACGVK